MPPACSISPEHVVGLYRFRLRHEDCLAPLALAGFNQIFLMIFLSTWLRRSNVLTGAEWIRTRFGSGTGANLAHISIVVFALVSVVDSWLTNSRVWVNSLRSFPWDLSPNTYALIILGITTIYVVKGGMFSVVLTEVMQFFIMTVSSIVVGVIAMMRVAPDTLDRLIPDGWKTLWFGWSLNLDWTQTLQSVNAKIAADGYELFTIFFMMLLFKGVLVSMAGPAPNYDMQRILATRNPREASLMSGFVSVVLFFPPI
jgi:Na+/proline symporter